MKVTIRIMAGPSGTHKVTKHTINKNIDAVERAIKGKPLAIDAVLLIDTVSILKEIRCELPER